MIAHNSLPVGKICTVSKFFQIRNFWGRVGLHRNLTKFSFYCLLIYLYCAGHSFYFATFLALDLDWNTWTWPCTWRWSTPTQWFGLSLITCVLRLGPGFQPVNSLEYWYLRTRPQHWELNLTQSCLLSVQVQSWSAVYQAVRSDLQNLLPIAEICPPGPVSPSTADLCRG